MDIPDKPFVVVTRLAGFSWLQSQAIPARSHILRLNVDEYLSFAISLCRGLPGLWLCTR